MWNISNGFFETLITLAVLGAIAGVVTFVYALYFLATHIQFIGF